MSSQLFGPYVIPMQHIFYSTAHSFAFVNLRPAIPGHVLIAPVRVAQHLSELSDGEVSDLFCAATKVSSVIKRLYPPADAVTLAVQDGPSAGQTVPHVHVHILPRHQLDRFNTAPGGNNTVYIALDKREEVPAAPRSFAEMEQEATKIRAFF